MVSVAYESERATLYHGDALEALEMIPKKSVGLLATDPPYGVKWRSGNRTKAFDKIVGDDGTLDVIGLTGAYVRAVLMVNRHVYVFGYRPDEVRMTLQFGGTAELVWDKGQVGMGNLELPWGPQHECISFGMFCPVASMRAKGYGNLSARMRQGSVLRVDRKNATAVTKHPTEKPVELMRRLIESSSSIGDVVLDPFVGSGSTLVAAVLSGRRGIGVEIDEKYVKVAVDRLTEAEKIADLIQAV